MDAGIGPLLMGVIPSIAVGGLFWFVMRGIIRADRREREAIAQMEREEAEREAKQ
jgi:hypothetical protein